MKSDIITKSGNSHYPKSLIIIRK